MAPLPDDKVAALLKKMESLANDFEHAAIDALTLSYTEEEDGADSLGDCAAYLKEALAMVRRSTASFGSRRRALPTAHDTETHSISLSLQTPTAERHLIDTKETFARALDPEEKEARELAALRAEFAAGAAADDEADQLDWTTNFQDGESDEDDLASKWVALRLQRFAKSSEAG